jgi:FkbM family methyltransferase
MANQDFKDMLRRSAKRLNVALRESPSQFGQDLFVLTQLGWKRDGYYVEFGAGDGHVSSNTWLMDRRLGWSGILAEPARYWHEELRAQGRTAHLEFDCVWSETGTTLTFCEAPEGWLSTVDAFREKDTWDRSDATTYEVSTISLLDMLAKYDAPATIDYLSLDTEGSELTILEAFDFTRYRFRCITCEHNFTEDREQIHALLTGHGYRRVLEQFSNVDDWYVSEG